VLFRRLLLGIKTLLILVNLQLSAVSCKALFSYKFQYTLQKMHHIEDFLAVLLPMIFQYFSANRSGHADRLFHDSTAGPHEPA
jgi:hypothetical protein